METPRASQSCSPSVSTPTFSVAAPSAVVSSHSWKAHQLRQLCRPERPSSLRCKAARTPQHPGARVSLQRNTRVESLAPNLDQRSAAPEASQSRHSPGDVGTFSTLYSGRSACDATIGAVRREVELPRLRAPKPWV